MNVSSKIAALLALVCFTLTAFAQIKPARLIVLDPGHFHATLLQKEMYPELDPRVSVYAPLSPDVVDYINRISLFNARAENPTHWELDVHTSDRPLEAMLKAPGRAGGAGIVVLSGRNGSKIDRIEASLKAGYNVLADKPWIIRSSDMPRLEQVLELAPKKGLAAYDIMTERYDVTEQVMRELVSSREVYGEQVRGDAAHPGVRAVSVHHLMKVVAGVPLRRPVWFFDLAEYGEGLADVGTHPVDLIQWILFPDQNLDYKKDVQIISGRHDAVRITKAQFAQVTGATEFPKGLPHVRDGVLDYYCNNYVEYALKGVRVKLDVLWKWEAPPGQGDAYDATFQGTKAKVELKGVDVYVTPPSPALEKLVATWQKRWPGVAVAKDGRIVIPEKFRVGHEAHFAQVGRKFFDYVKNPQSLPSWEKGYMLTKYYITTKGVEMAK